MLGKMLPARSIKVGHLIHVNGRFVRVTHSESRDTATRGRWFLGWEGSDIGILMKYDTLNRVIIPNARFWVWEHDGWVKLTLKPGQVLATDGGGPNEEGFSCWRQAWEYDADDGIVISRSHTWGRDCDGPHQRHAESTCKVSELQALPPQPADPEWQVPEIPVPRPTWQHGASSQRDVYAETMGY